MFVWVYLQTMYVCGFISKTLVHICFCGFTSKTSIHICLELCLCVFASKTLVHISPGKKRSTKPVPPKPTNQQCARALEDWSDPEGAGRRRRLKKKCNEESSEPHGEGSSSSGLNGERGSRSRSKQPRSKSCAPPGNVNAQPPRHRFGCPRIQAHAI